MRRRPTNALALAFAAASMSTFIASHAAGQASEGPGSTRSPEPFVQLVFDPVCADTDHAALLANQLRVRMPDTMVVTGTLRTEGEWIVRWEPAAEGCVLNFSASETSSTMVLKANADVEQIELAASRVAFLATVTAPAGAREEMPLGVPGEEIDEAALAREELPQPPDAPPSGSSTEPPPPPPPLEEPDGEGTDEPSPPEEPDDAVVEQTDESPGADESPEADSGDETELAGANDEPAPDRYSRPETVVEVVPGLPFPRGDGRPMAPGFVWGAVGSTTAGADGIALGTIFNSQSDFARGVQLASIFNYGGDVDAIQTAGVLNIADSFSGIQMAGVVNIANGQGTGSTIQLAGVTNVHTGAVEGIQFAGVANVATGGLDGFALAGAVNVADHVNGGQVALVNVAGKVSGAQVGLVNVAESSDVSIGLVNIVYSEPFWFTGETASDGFTLAGMRHGSTYLKWSLWAGTSLIADQPLALVGVGLGFHIPLGDFYIDGDIVGMDVTGSQDSGTNAGTLEFRLTGGYDLLSWLSLYAGGGVRGFASDGTDFGIVPNFAMQAGDQTGGTAVWPFVFLGARL